MRDVQIRPAQEADLAVLVDAFGDEDFFIDRLAKQENDKGELLTAWAGPAPIGVVYLWLEDAEEPEVREHLPGVPLLNRVEVLTEQRNQGVGTELMRAAEQRVATRGYDQVALAVRTDNSRARRLYHRLGYEVWPYSAVECRLEVRLSDGSRKGCPVTCNMLVKQLRDSNE